MIFATAVCILWYALGGVLGLYQALLFQKYNMNIFVVLLPAVAYPLYFHYSDLTYSGDSLTWRRAFAFAEHISWAVAAAFGYWHGSVLLSKI
jgi:hypothetical protein